VSVGGVYDNGREFVIGRVVSERCPRVPASVIARQRAEPDSIL
jgi:hypothetical protein